MLQQTRGQGRECYLLFMSFSERVQVTQSAERKKADEEKLSKIPFRWISLLLLSGETNRTLQWSYEPVPQFVLAVGFFTKYLFFSPYRYNLFNISSSVGMETVYRLDGRGIEFLFPAGVRHFSNRCTKEINTRCVGETKRFLNVKAGGT